MPSGKEIEAKDIGVFIMNVITQVIGVNALKECGTVVHKDTALVMAETAISLSNSHINRN